jgi:ferredoxin
MRYYTAAFFGLAVFPCMRARQASLTNTRRNEMAYVITDKCTNCGSCVEVCPVEAISKGEKKHNIDADKCVDCGACAGECPVEAIEPGA